MPEIDKLIGQIGPVGPARQGGKAQSRPAEGTGFEQVLESERLRLSGHAATRLKGRNIALLESDWARVNKAVDLAAKKGSRESLVLVDDVALVISVRNRTVITAVDKDNLKENVFTNIDSAVIV